MIASESREGRTGTSRSEGPTPRRGGRALASMVALVGLAACAQAAQMVPETRPVVNRQGARLMLDEERAQSAFRWVEDQISEIEENPTFWVISSPSTSDLFPWESLDVTPTGDSATVQYPRTVPDVARVYRIYAHLEIVSVRGTIEEWLPGADTLAGWDLEVAKVARMTEAWLLGRASYSFTPYEPLDQLTYAAEEGMLEPLLLSLRGYEFPEARDAWLAENPGGEAAFRQWYEETLGGEPEPISGGDGA